ncbi:MAG: ferredoxin [Salinivirgaceae bacterium]|nr:ferredoxin [Salinivirgaceae bacterium]MDY0279948.1 ferredoxin [Salinivirgaceae bacterium]
MAIKKVWIDEGCISCGLCEEICPDVFKVNDVAEVIEDTDFNKFEDGIKEAAQDCPVEVIKYE